MSFGSLRVDRRLCPHAGHRPSDSSRRPRTCRSPIDRSRSLRSCRAYPCSPYLAALCFASDHCDPAVASWRPAVAVVLSPSAEAQAPDAHVTSRVSTSSGSAGRGRLEALHSIPRRTIVRGRRVPLDGGLHDPPARVASRARPAPRQRQDDRNGRNARCGRSLDQGPPGVRRHVRGIDNGRASRGHALPELAMQDRERGSGDALVALVAGDRGAERVRREHLASREEARGERRLPGASSADKHDEDFRELQPHPARVRVAPPSRHRPSRGPRRPAGGRRMARPAPGRRSSGSASSATGTRSRRRPACPR